MESELSILWTSSAADAFRFLFMVLVIVVASIIVLRTSKEVLGFDIRGVLNHVEKSAKQYAESKGAEGSLWPVVVLLLGGLASVAFLGRGFLG